MRTFRMISCVIIVGLLFANACSKKSVETQNYNQGVTGTVMYKPGYDGELFINLINPPDQTPRPLPGAEIYLIKYACNEKDSMAVETTAITDSLGNFIIKADTGKYYLAVLSNIPSTVTYSVPGCNCRLHFLVNDISKVYCKKDEFTDCSFLLHEMSTQ